MLYVANTLSILCEMGITPFVEINPCVTLTPQRPCILAGATTEPSVSVPMDTLARLAVTAAAGPELEPDGSSVKLYGFLV